MHLSCLPSVSLSKSATQPELSVPASEARPGWMASPGDAPLVTAESSARRIWISARNLEVADRSM